MMVKYYVLNEKKKSVITKNISYISLSRYKGPICDLYQKNLNSQEMLCTLRNTALIGLFFSPMAGEI